jgi:hypothetical protein
LQADLRRELELFFTLEPGDSVAGLERLPDSRLTLNTVNTQTGNSREETAVISAQALNGLLVSASDEGVPVALSDDPFDPFAEATDTGPAPTALAFGGNAPSAAASAPSRASSEVRAPSSPVTPPRAISADPAGEALNRRYYIIWQTLLSTSAYGFAPALAFGDRTPRVLIAAPLITAPIAFGAHLWYAQNRPFTDAHRKGTFSLSGLALYTSYALPMAFTSDFETGFQTSVITSMLLYPAGIGLGYRQGDIYASMPGRIDTQFKFAMGFLMLGFFTPMLYYEHPDDHVETVLRLGLGQSAGFALAGHFMADYYRTGEDLPDGVPTGILTHTLLGAGTGAWMAALLNANSFRPWTGASLVGGTLGFMEGLLFFQNRYDSREKGYYSALGSLGGGLMGAGIHLLVMGDDPSTQSLKIGWTSSVLAGAWLGYATTYFLITAGMEEDRRAQGGLNDAYSQQGWSFNPLPTPEPVLGLDGNVRTRWRVPGVSLRF